VIGDRGGGGKHLQNGNNISRRLYRLFSTTKAQSFRVSNYGNQTGGNDGLMSYGQWNLFSHSFSIDIDVLRTIRIGTVARRAFISIEKYNITKSLPVGH